MPYKDKAKQKAAQAAHYQANKPAYKNRLIIKRRKLRRWFLELKMKSKCVRCGENHPACIEFHHTYPTNKIEDISVMVKNAYSLANIEEELKKCEPLCSNCHRKEHWYLDKTAGLDG